MTVGRVGRGMRWASVGLIAAAALLGCDEGPPAAPEPPEEPERPEKPSGTPSAQGEAPRRGPDPLLLKVCAAYDEVAAEGVQQDVVLQSAALRAVREHGVTEAQLAELGAHPHEVLASIRERGSPPQCDAFAKKLEALAEQRRP